MDKIPYLRKDNFYTNSELSLIMRELNYLTADNVILSDDILQSGAGSIEMTTKKLYGLIIFIVNNTIHLHGDWQIRSFKELQVNFMI